MCVCLPAGNDWVGWIGLCWIGWARRRRTDQANSHGDDLDMALSLAAEN